MNLDRHYRYWYAMKPNNLSNVDLPKHIHCIIGLYWQEMS